MTVYRLSGVIMQAFKLFGAKDTTWTCLQILWQFQVVFNIVLFLNANKIWGPAHDILVLITIDEQWRLTKLRLCAVSSEPSLLAYTKYDCDGRLMQKYRHVDQRDSCAGSCKIITLRACDSSVITWTGPNLFVCWLEINMSVNKLKTLFFFECNRRTWADNVCFMRYCLRSAWLDVAVPPARLPITVWVH